MLLMFFCSRCFWNSGGGNACIPLINHLWPRICVKQPTRVVKCWRDAATKFEITYVGGLKKIKHPRENQGRKDEALKDVGGEATGDSCNFWTFFYVVSLRSFAQILWTLLSCTSDSFVWMKQQTTLILSLPATLSTWVLLLSFPCLGWQSSKFGCRSWMEKSKNYQLKY